MSRTVVAISSFVMRGTVGLRAAVFALERRGATVWAAPTVILPWHPGLGPSTRAAVDPLPKQLDELAAHAGAVDLVLTGYFASAAQVDAAARFIKAVRETRRDALVVVDPVTGDENGRYVPDAVAEAICDHLLPLADVATPNINELRDLSADGSIEAARKMGARSVVVTSAIQETEKIGAWVVTPDGCDEIKHPRIAEPARGTGDFFSAVLASALLDDPANVTAAARTAAAATYGVVAGSGSVALDLPANQAAIVSPDLSLVIGG